MGERCVGWRSFLQVQTSSCGDCSGLAVCTQSLHGNKNDSLNMAMLRAGISYPALSLPEVKPRKRDNDAGVQIAVWAYGADDSTKP